MANSEKSTFRKVSDVATFGVGGIALLAGAPLIPVAAGVAVDYFILNPVEDKVFQTASKKVKTIWQGKRAA